MTVAEGARATNRMWKRPVLNRKVDEIAENHPLRTSRPMHDKRERAMAIGIGKGFITWDECA
jgi:hypothetical protein